MDIDTGFSAGKKIDRYVVEAFLGEGGVAMVYRVRHVHLDSLHALKVLAVNDAETKRRLIDEGKSQASLRHPNIVAVTDAFLYEGQPCLIIDYVEGPSLHDLLEEHAPTLEEALEVFRGILRGVHAAHRHGLVHRDLKPENVLLAKTAEGIVPKVADFGLVKILARGSGQQDTEGGTFLGTPQYMSPEQISNPARVDHRADMFSLGCLLFEMVCGEMAFDAENTYDALNRIMNKEYSRPESLNPDLPETVISAIDGLLAHDAAERTPDCATVIALLYGNEEHLGSNNEDTQEIARKSIIRLGSETSKIIHEHDTGQPSPRRWATPAAMSTHLRAQPKPALSPWAERCWVGLIAFMSGLLGVIVGLYTAKWLGLLVI